MIKIPDYSQTAGPSRRHLVWFLFCRVLVVTLLLGGTIVYHFGGAAEPQFLLTSLYLLVGIYYGQTIIAAVVLSKVRRRRFFVQAQIVWDMLFIASLIYITGSIDSPFHFLFYLVVISASVFLARKEIFFVASAAAILFGSLLDLQYYGYLPHLPMWSFRLLVDSREVFYAVFINIVTIFSTAVLSGILVERLRRSEQALEKKKIDYEELENFNRTIMANIGSGLMVVNGRGRIRSFNRAAERLSGFTLEEVYDRAVGELFPSFAVYDGTFRIVERGEGILEHRNAGRRIFGYTSSLIHGADGHDVGMLVTFQDLTWLKEMEERLKRADRLAAVGQLASGMAHEIRNPLASISGSVQLLMEGETVREEDRRLMRIVVKEADRLSSLLTDFLLYARPGPPKITDIDVSAVLDELTVLAAADPRFAAVEIRRAYPPGVVLPFDRRQLHQALWNLVINSAEAMPDGGTIVLGVGADGREIFVEDSGPGIPDAIRNRIFNPFFTTKDRGTGLGLATVYSIVEAHGGSVSVGTGSQGGARFVIRLPAAGITAGAQGS